MAKSEAFNMDCVTGMRELPDGCIDMTVTSPPYDNLRTYNGNISQWSFEKFKQIAKELYRITADGGVVVWVVGDATIKGSETGTSFRQALWFMKCGFWLYDTMIYQTSKPPMNDRRYQQSFEYMFVFSKGKPKVFNPIQEKCKYAGKIVDGTYYNADGSMKKRSIVGAVHDTKPKENIWRIVERGKSKGHPAAFPYQLAHDHIISWSNEGDTVLDPFLGSGTTRIAAYDTNRNFIGYEIDETYFRLQEERFERHTAQMNMIIDWREE